MRAEQMVNKIVNGHWNIFIKEQCFCFFLMEWKLIIFVSNSWTCNIKLSMRKAWFFKVYASNWEGLSLGFIYGYCKVQFHWKLQSLERNCYISWDQRYSCNENIFYFTISRMVAWIRCGIIFLITSLVPLQSLSGSRFLNYWSSNFEI